MNDNDEDLLADLLLRWEDLRETGQDTSASELCQDHPHLIDELARRIQALKVISWLDSPVSDSETVDPVIASSYKPRTLIGRYRLDKLIAEGGFAQVWRGYDLELQRIVAVKVPKSNRLQSAEAFMAEARRVARLKHPGIVQVYDVGRQGEVCFIVTEFVEGGSLGDLLLKNTPSHQQTIRWLVEIADALNYAHVHGVIHRDIKPANILIDHHGRALLADFGIAQSANKVGQQALSLGTLRYMSPEQLEGREIDPRSDIFSLGVVLHETLTGKLPYSSAEPNVLRREIVAGVKDIGSTEMPVEFKRICQKALQRNPQDRYVSAEQFSAELRCYSPSSGPSKSRHSVLRWFWPVAGVLMIVGLSVVWVNLSRNDSLKNETTLQSKASDTESNENTLAFDGTNRIITPLISFAPCTLEAWVRKSGDRREQFIIGSDVPHNHGIGIGFNNKNPIVEVIHGGFGDEMPVTPGKWTHIAAVYGPDETKLFIDGKKTCVGAATLPPSIQTHFVIGNVGEDHKVMFYRGQIRCLRISKGERYSSDFVPERSFGPDDDDSAGRAVLIFDGSKIEGDRVIDLSGNGNDGKWAVEIR